MVLCLAPAALAQTVTKLLRQPDISKTGVVFVYGGDLWVVPRSGGLARRLTANPSIKRYPKFSPDGKWIAFTGNYDGNSDVYIIPSEGGEPRRLTYHPAGDGVLGWTPDSRAVLFRSNRFSPSQRVSRLFTVSINGGMEKPLPLQESGLASFSPDGTKLAYNRIDREFATWKRYRGGFQSYISLYDLKNNAYSEIPHTDTTDFYPMWHGDKIYFASDRTNTVNLFCYDLKAKSAKQLTHYSDYDVKWPSLGPDAIVFEQGGTLKMLDLTSEKVTSIPAEAPSDLTSARPGLRRVESNIRSFGISPSGVRAVFEARGEIFTAPAKKGDTRDITNTPGIREINPAWSPDGRYIAYLSDRSGEYELCYRPQDGSGTETRLTTDGHVYRYGPIWSPDSKALLYTDADMKLWMITLAEKKPTLVDSSTIATIDLGRWSPDSKWVAYTKTLPSQITAIHLYSVDQRKSFQISDGFYADREPTFDQNGKYLYFVSDRTFTPSIIGPEINIGFQNTAGLFALVLSADAPSPLAPESDEEKPKEDSSRSDSGKADAAKPDNADRDRANRAEKKSGTEPVKIDMDGLYRRLVALPVQPGNYAGLTAGNGKLFYMAVAANPGQEEDGDGGGGALHLFDLTSREDKTVLGGIQGYDLNPAGSKILYKAGPIYGIVDAAPGASVGAGKLTLALEMHSDPRAEWKQVFHEAWRYERDFYYDPNMHGLDWNAIGERYAQLVPNVSNRDDLTYLIGELIGELNTSHSYVQGAEPPPVKQVNVGLLGVDFEADNGYYRIKKIYPGENWNPSRRSPLTEPGIKVKAGDYLIAVNGVPLRADTNPYAPFEGLAGKLVTLKVNSSPSDVGGHDVQVRPVESEAGLRYLDWVENNRRKVEQATGGRVGYVHVPDTATGGMTEFGKGFYAQTDKEAMIVDERYNSGGFVPDFFVEKLGRRLLAMGMQRYGMNFKQPGGAVYGPKVILENEWSGSGGDAFPWLFRKAGVGPIIGKRTWGGLVGINGFYDLMDGGGVSVPQFGFWSPQEGKWVAENHGVDPDIEVNNTPDQTSQGHDPQLERAIAYIQDQLKKNPPQKYQHPPFAVEKLTTAAK
jgi:tricorn protease